MRVGAAVVSRAFAIVTVAALTACGASGSLDAPGERKPRAGSSSYGDVLDPELRSALANAESTYYRSEYDSARALLRSALATSDVAGDSIGRARALTWLGLTEWKQANYVAAKNWGEQALALEQRLHLTRELGRTYNALGLVAFYQGRYGDALALFSSELDSGRVLHDSVALTKATANLGLVWTDLGDYPRARGAFEQTRAMMFARGDKRSAGNALSNLGMVDIRLGNPASALRTLATARATYDTLDYAPGVESALGQMAEAYAAEGQAELAFAYTDSALAIARHFGLRQQEVDGLRHKAVLYFNAGDLQRSLDYFEQSRSLASTIGVDEVQAEITRDEARVLAALGDLDRASVRASEALSTHRRLEMPFDQLADQLLIAELAHRSGYSARATKALDAAERTLDRFPLGIARVLVALTTARIADADGRAQRVLGTLDAVQADLARVGPGFNAEADALRTRSLVRLGRLNQAVECGATKRRRARIAAKEIRHINARHKLYGQPRRCVWRSSAGACSPRARR